MTKVYDGYLRMMSHTGLNPVKYSFHLVNYPNATKKEPGLPESFTFPINDSIGGNFQIKFSGEIRCVDCGKITKKTFQGGSCYKCFISLPSNDLCILKPSLCHFHLGTCRDPTWGEKHCFQKHIVYLANSTGIKVGITKENPYTKRWVDQGAISGLPIFRVDSRLESGVIEEEFSKFISDKSSWQKLISEDSQPIDLKKISTDLKERIDFKKIKSSLEYLEEEVVSISYPIQSYPQKKVSLKPNITKPTSEILRGIKGQYLLFGSGGMNIRSLEGYHVEVSICN